MSVLSGVLRTRPGRTRLTPGFTGRGGPSWEAKSRFMRAMGRGPLQANLAAKAGVMLGAPQESETESRLKAADEWDRRQKVQEAAREERAQAEARLKAQAKADEAQAQERSMAALELPPDLAVAVKGGQITLGQAMTAMSNRRAEKTRQGGELLRRVGAPLGRAAKAVGGFLERGREMFEEAGTTGQELAAKKEQEDQERMEEELAEAEQREARVAAFGQKRPDLSPAQLEDYVTGGVTPTMPPSPGPQPGLTPEEGVDALKAMRVDFFRKEEFAKLVAKQRTKTLNDTEQAMFDYLKTLYMRPAAGGAAEAAPVPTAATEPIAPARPLPPAPDMTPMTPMEPAGTMTPEQIMEPLQALGDAEAREVFQALSSARARGPLNPTQQTAYDYLMTRARDYDFDPTQQRAQGPTAQPQTREEREAAGRALMMAGMAGFGQRAF